ncbi:MAG: hypothetical protein RLZZ347_382 [Candidatus Parcubacteria bacterium]|jgi:deoxycytidylate deaminase
MTIQYPYIPTGRTILYVNDGNEFMQEAKRWRNTQSSESVQPTGAVIVKNGKIVSGGANQSRLRSKWLSKLHSRLCIRKICKVKTGTKYWLCPGCATYKEHAEAQAVMDGKKRGVDMSNSDLYLYGHWWCCKPCWDAMIGGGIKDVHLLSGSEILFNRSHPENALPNRVEKK